MASGFGGEPDRGGWQTLGGAGSFGEAGILPSWELFAEQDQAYRDSVLLRKCAQGLCGSRCFSGWRQWVGDQGRI